MTHSDKHIATSVLVKVRVARRLSDLKLGYRTWLTIIHDKNNISTGSRNRHCLGKILFLHPHDESVSDATRAPPRDGKADKFPALPPAAWTAH